MTLTEVCQHLKNWFNRKPNGEDLPRWKGTFTIANGSLQNSSLVEGQYFRIQGSLFNDGVHKVGDVLTDEVFEGTVGSMSVPPEIVALVAEISAWQDKYGGVDSVNLSPYNSESFGGYSYSKSGGGAASTASGGAGTWQAAYESRLKMWRKM